MTATRVNVEDFHAQGFAVLRAAVPEAQLTRLDELVREWEALRAAPLELESDIGYPGAPDPAAPTQSVRRFLQVFQRDDLFRELLLKSGLVELLGALLGSAPILSLAHHNCLMTKEPRLSSDTPWHRDRRFWSFEHDELITTWIALGDEPLERGGLRLVPGSHRIDLPPACFDEREALRAEAEEVRSIVDGAVAPSLTRGDVLLFHCRLLHSASRNFEASPKRSLVFTFRSDRDAPLPGTRSASGGEVRFGEPR